MDSADPNERPVKPGEICQFDDECANEATQNGQLADGSDGLVGDQHLAASQPDSTPAP